MIGFGSESVGMGGADTAVARDTSALNTNPAGLTQISGGQLDFNTAMAYALDIRHKDQLGNDAEIANKVATLGELAYAQRLESRSVAFGIGLFAQGGSGVVYHDLTTPFGNQDEFSSLFRIAKLSTGIAWNLNPSFSLGASLGLIYADLNQKIFPDTSVYNASAPQQSFFGYKLQNMQAMNLGYKLGAMLKPTDRLTFGMAYTSKVNLDLNGGQLISDLSAVGLGKVTYHDVQVKGLNLPQELELGTALQTTPHLLVSMKLSWIDWSGAVKSSTLKAGDPDRTGAPSIQSATAKMDWRDQDVIAVGLAYDLTDNAVLRMGYNFGRNPIPKNTLSPLLAAITQHNVTAGGGYRLTPHWRLDGAAEYDVREKVRYTNPSLPFGPNTEAVYETVAIYFTLSYRI